MKTSADVEDVAKRIQARARDADEGTDGFVHSKPWSAIGIAAAAGAAGIAKILFFVFLLFALVAVLSGLFKRA